MLTAILRIGIMIKLCTEPKEFRGRPHAGGRATRNGLGRVQLPLIGLFRVSLKPQLAYVSCRIVYKLA